MVTDHTSVQSLLPLKQYLSEGMNSDGRAYYFLSLLGILLSARSNVLE